jgi:acetylornithine/succinyldiaminopimelate/putrescine aminotransferase
MLEAKESSAQQPLYEMYVNPQWVQLLDVLGMNADYTHCAGSELFTEDGRRILDFNSGYCVHNVRHKIESIVDLMHASTGFWTEALGMARRVINVI